MKISINSNISLKFDNDTIIVTDPCYVISHSVGLDDEWMEFVHGMDEAGTLVIDGMTALYVSTAYGDGGYPVKMRGKVIGEAGVDAGILSVWKLSDAMKVNPSFRPSSGVVIEGVSGIVLVDAKEHCIDGEVLCETDYVEEYDDMEDL